jgi:hypothetical protein
MGFGVAIETGATGIWYGRLIDYIGTHARAMSKDSLMNELLLEKKYHEYFLEDCGINKVKPGRDRFHIVEEVRGIEDLGESGGAVALFKFDMSDVNLGFLNHCIEIMGCNRRLLFNEIKSLDTDILNHTPPGKGRNINQILHHISSAEEFYISRLGEQADIIYENNLQKTQKEANNLPPIERLSLVRGAAVKTLEILIPDKIGVFTRNEYTRYPDEKWTAHKVLRRFLEHEREHIYNIREYLGKPLRYTD